MASRRGSGFHTRPNYIYPAPAIAADFPESSVNLFEFDEADLWKSSNQGPATESRKIFPISKKLPKRSAEKTVKAASSLPVNVPDWSKILQSEHGGRATGGEFEDGGDGDGAEEIGMVPPHEYLARRRGESLSVHEGIGRTLKGRDLRRVRNAIWKKTGFED